jgi:hypothetical protein
MHPARQAVRSFWVECAKAGEAAKGSLNVSARTAEPVIQIEMPERGVQIVAPHQSNDATAEPNAFRITGRSVDNLRRFRELVDFALIVPGGVRLGWSAGILLWLFLRAYVATLGGGGTYRRDICGKSDQSENRASANKRIYTTHENPESILLMPGRGSRKNAMRMGCLCGRPFRAVRNQMTEIQTLVQQS